MQFLEDRISGGGPLEGLAVRVVGRDEVVDALNELFDAGERTAPDCLVGDQREETFNLVEPRAVGRYEVHMPARVRRQPCLDLRMVVGGVVVRDAMDVQFGWHSLVDLTQEGQELLVPMTWFAGRQHRAVEHVQRGEQRGRAMALVVVGDSLDVAEPHGQHRLRALQRLTLALLVHADDQRVVRRAQIQAHHVAQLLDEERVVGQLEAFGAMRLQPEELEVPRNAGLGDACLGRHRAHAPMCRAIGWLSVQRRLDQLRHTFIVNRARLASAHVVIQTRDASLDEARAPLAHRRVGQLQALGNGIVGLAIGTAEDDARPNAQRRRQRAAASKGLQLRTLLVRQQQLRLRSACSHRGISVPKIPDRHARLMPETNGTGH